MSLKPTLEAIIRDRDNALRKQYFQHACDCGCPISGLMVAILYQTIAYEVNLTKDQLAKGLEIWKAFQKQGCLKLQGKNRINIAAALVWMASVLIPPRVTQWKLEKITGITQVAIRNIYPTLGRFHLEFCALLDERETDLNYFNKRLLIEECYHQKKRSS